MKSEAALGGGKGRGREIARENEREKGQRKQKESPKRGRKYAKGKECAELCEERPWKSLSTEFFYTHLIICQCAPRMKDE